MSVAVELKGDFKVVKELRARSGMGWDGALCTVTAAPDVWDKACKANSKFKKWRKKAFPLYETMAELIGEVVATGEGALVLSKPSRKDGKVKGDEEKPAKVKADQEDETKKRRRSRTDSEPDTSVIEVNDSGDDTNAHATPAAKRHKTATGGRKPSGAAAVQGVAGSLDRLGDTLADVLGTKAAEAADAKVAKRRSEAIVMVSNMTNLALAQRAQAIRLFANATTVELLLEIPDAALRVAFVEELLSAEAPRVACICALQLFA
ncbi:hypothetical protein AURDEDRAFT_127614 [Auricularia subglabra TFB-10046 SS5]|nr:hypothetical protein AURDEDRAFT_127614 [Auricularia subglabra TFB-10046 SS5]